MSDLDRFLKTKRTGDFDSEGSFTLNPDRARDLLKDFQAPNPHYSLLKLIQAGIAYGSRSIHLKHRGNSAYLHFEEPKEMPDLTGWHENLRNPLQVATNRADRHMAVGLTTILKLYDRVEWFLPRQKLTIDQNTFWIEAVELPEQGCHLSLWSSGRGPMVPWRWIAERTMYSPIPVTFNGKASWDLKPDLPIGLLDFYLAPRGEEKLSIPFEPGCTWIESDQPFLYRLRKTPFELFTPKARARLLRTYPGQPLERRRSDCRMFGQIGLERRAQSKLRAVVDGVLLEPFEWTLPVTLEVIVANPKLTLDLTEFSVVQDAELTNFLDKLEKRALSLANDVSPYLEKSVQKDLGLTANVNKCKKCNGWWLVRELPTYRDDLKRYRAVSNKKAFVASELTLWPSSDSIRMLELLKREAAARHPLLLKTLEVSKNAHSVYRVREFCPYPTLDQELPEADKSHPRAEKLLLSLTRTLLELRERGHGGLLINPRLENFHIRDQQFLLAPQPKYLEKKQHAILSLPPAAHYWLCSPEELLGGECQEKTEVYLVGTVGYFLFTGGPPVDCSPQASSYELAQMVLQHPPVDPRARRPGLKPALAEVLRRCVARDPAERPRSLAETLDWLILAGL